LNRNNSPEVESHCDIQPGVDIFASPDRRDLGGLSTDIEGIIGKLRPTLPRGSTINLRGQVDTMRSSFTRLGLGMIFAVVLV
jgi:multidrug efflux pump subunit AcrB